MTRPLACLSRALLTLIGLPTAVAVAPPAAAKAPTIGSQPAAESGSPGLAGAPQTARRPVTDPYHGTRITEDYRWLENGSDSEVKAWSEEQNRWARSYLDALPSVPALAKRLKELEASTSPDYTRLQYRGGKLFAIKTQPPKEQPFLVTLKSADDPASARVLVDPNRIDPHGGTAIDFYVPSVDGKKVAVSLSKGGSEDGSVHIYEVASGKELPDVIPRVNYGTAGGSLAWNEDGSGFHYTRYPREGERSGRDMLFYQQVYFHKLGTPPSEDRYALGKGFPKIAEVHLESSDDGRHVLASVANGDGGEFAHYLLRPGGSWKQISIFADRIAAATFGPDGALYLLSRDDAPKGKILRLPLTTTDMRKATTVVPESDSAIQGFEPAADTLYVVDLVGGPAEIRLFDLKSLHTLSDRSAPARSAVGNVPRLPGREEGTQSLGKVPLAPISSVREILRLKGDEILYRSETFLDPPSWKRFRPGLSQPLKTALKRTSPADFKDTEVVREFATSKDGTKIPVNILRLKGTKLDGRNPTLLTGYGAYGISLSPRFSESRRAWIEQGCVFAVANLRGGGEFGDDWHRSGHLTRKQTVFDDFAAAAHHMIDAKYTSREKLAIEGRSNGGLLMGAALTQHPELYRAVVSHVGVYDMLRVELSPNGEFNITEFGTVKDPDHFKALYAYSPYHHVVDAAAYPAILFMTGANDPRVDPANSRKMAARLQAASSSGLPILLRTSAHSGHGIGSSLSEDLAQHVDVLAFLFDQLGIAYRPVEGTIGRDAS